MRYQQITTSHIIKPLFAVGIGLVISTGVSAHNIVSGVYADGMKIEGEIGFSNGDMAAAGVVVEVFDEAGEKQGETALVEGGMFVYQAKTVQKYIFKANLSSGHIAEMMIEADELSNDAAPVAQSSANRPTTAKPLASQSSIADVSNTQPQNVGPIAPGVSVAELQSMIRSAVAQQVRPLQKELRAYKEKVMFRDVAGGLGFIFGLFGVAAWMASKRKEKEG